ncbi:MAG: cadherin-like domain-containing protein, partial [Rhodobacteraceae bacterium]|nr:cadherin-like domain-containing protein [Paracoccaceae bacterium]
GQTLFWDFSATGNNLPGPSGFGGGITGVMSDGSTNPLAPVDEGGLDITNAKFITAAGGGTTVVEQVGSGSPSGANNDGEYFFHTGFRAIPGLDSIDVKVSLINPFESGSVAGQEYGAYLGVGDQSNFLKIVAAGGQSNEILVQLENSDSILQTSTINADGIFDGSGVRFIDVSFEIDLNADTITPVVAYQTSQGGAFTTVAGSPIDISNTNLLDAINGSYMVGGQSSGVAVGMFATAGNSGQTFTATMDDITITGEGDVEEVVLFRINAGGELITATDGGPNWEADTDGAENPALVAGGNKTTEFLDNEPGVDVPANIPAAIFDTERSDDATGEEMQYAFDVSDFVGTYEVRLYIANGFPGTALEDQRIFDVSVEGTVPANFDNIDPIAAFGGTNIGGVLTTQVTVTDGELNLEFLHDAIDGIENPLINGIEIVQIVEDPDAPALLALETPTPSIVAENGDAGVTTLEFPIDVSKAPSGPVTVTYEVSINGGAPTTGTATVDASGGTVTVEVPNDDLPNGDEEVQVTLTGFETGGDIAELSGNVTATATVSDDDPAPGASNPIYRVNSGGELIVATDGGPDWVADTGDAPTVFLTEAGTGNTTTIFNVAPGETVPGNIPADIFLSERSDNNNADALDLTYDFAVEAGTYEVRLYVGNGFIGANSVGARVFDASVEGVVPTEFDDIDPVELFGVAEPGTDGTGGVISTTVEVTDGGLTLSFLHGSIENPQINGIEILEVVENTAPVGVDDTATLAADDGATVIDVIANDTDADSDPLFVQSVDTTGTLGTVVNNGDGTVSYDPNGQFDDLPVGETATDTFTYIATDGAGDSAATTVTVTINGTFEPDPTNTAPGAPTVTPSAGGLPENAAAGTVVATLAAIDADGDDLTFTLTNAAGAPLANDFLEIVGNELVVKAGADIDFETLGNAINGLFVVANDGTVDSTTTGFNVPVTDVAEDVVLGDGGVVYADTGESETSITGGTGDDEIRGGSGDDIISGGEGDDAINGGADDDILTGGAGNDVLRGNSGDDEIRGGDGDDELYGGGGVDMLFGEGGNDLMLGVTGDDQLFGGAGDDNMFGRANNDSLDGGEGDDRLTGNQGDDVMIGGAGRDVMVGGGGNDTMTGGEGVDFFVFLNERGEDVITDFEVGTDNILMANRTFGDRGVEFTDLEIAQVGADTVVTERGLQITLEGVDASTLTENDFIF